MDAALELFSMQGYEATSVSQLAEAVGIRKASLYSHFRYILHDTHISRARKMLTVEQFRNEQMAQLQTKQNYTNVMCYFTGLIRFLIRQGQLADHDAELMAAQLCLPISVWINLCDREPEREDEVMKLIEQHIRQFFEMYREKS